MKLGTKKLPQLRLSLKLILDLKLVFDKYGKNEISVSDLSVFLGHKSPKSGTFLYKISSFRSFGLMEGRGKVTVTDIGEEIVLRENNIDYNDALISAVNRVPLWGIIFTKYTKVGKEIQEDKFWSELKEHCGLTVEESQKRSPEILKFYREDIRLINMSLLVEKSPSVTIDDVLVISYGKYNVTLPNEFSEREDVGEILKSMIDLSIKPKKIKLELDKVEDIEELQE